jgi:metal-responsive CopG/Arc/MetJ family transcriptional regulator
MRTIVDLPDEQLGALARLCEEQKISRAEAVRRAVSHLIKENAAKRKDVGFGIWRHKRLDSRKYVEKLRGEWRDR